MAKPESAAAVLAVNLVVFRPEVHELARRRTRRRRRLALFVARLAVLLLLWQSARAEEIVIGQTLSLTRRSATIGNDLLRGRQACIDYVNTRGGIRGNRLRLRHAG